MSTITDKTETTQASDVYKRQVMGSGGMIVADETTCMVEFATYFMQFVCDESCGKCPPCRIGSTRMLEILQRITAGKGQPGDIGALYHLAEGMQKGSLCALDVYKRQCWR